METMQQPPAAPPPPPAQVQIIPPLSQAWDHMKSQLFPFNLGRWFTLGFVAWLATMGGSFNFNYHFNSSPFKRGSQSQGPGEFYSATDKMLEFADAHAGLVMLFVALFVLCVLGLFVLIAYFRSRGLFMYIDCIVRRTAAVKEPWRRTRDQAWQMFILRLVAGGILWAALLIVGYLLLMTLLPAIRSHSVGIEQAVPIVLAVLALTPVFLFWALVTYIANELLAPIMYLRGMRMAEAWKELRRIGRGNFWSFVLFGFMQVVIGMLYGVLTIPAVCCTCCIGALPVIHQTILQPILMWMRAYPLYFLAQFGPEYAMPLWPGPERTQPGAPVALVVPCSHCGQPHQIPGGAKGQYLCSRCGKQFDVT